MTEMKDLETPLVGGGANANDETTWESFKNIEDPYEFCVVFEVPDEECHKRHFTDEQIQGMVEDLFNIQANEIQEFQKKFPKDDFQGIFYLKNAVKFFGEEDKKGVMRVKETKVMELVYQAFLDVCHTKLGYDTYSFYSRDQDEIFVKVRAADAENIKVIAESNSYKLQIDEKWENQEYFKDRASAFITYNDSYEKNGRNDVFRVWDEPGRASQKGIFRQVDRQRLLMDNLCGHFDLVFLCEKSKLGKEFYCLHNHVMLDELKNEWAQMNKWTSWDIPVEKIRNYYGEKIALYYVWLQNYTQWLIVPAIAGVIAFVLQMIVGAEIDPNKTLNTTALVSTFFSFVVAMWCSVFCEFWGRKQSQYAVSWGTKDFLEIEPPRPDFEGDKELNPVTEKYERMYPSWRRNSKLVFSFFSMIFMVCIVVTIVFILLKYRGKWRQEGQKGLVYLAAGLNSIQIKVFNVIYGMMATSLNNWENHRTETEYEDALIVKIFLFQFVNSYNSFFFLAFYKPILWADTCTAKPNDPQCDFMGQLSIQLGIIFCVGMVMNAVELGVPYIKQKMEMKKEKDAVIANADKYERVYMYPAEFESKLGEYDGTMGDYLEMVIQYGFVTLFCAGFPLTPLLAFLNNMAEMRVDAIKLCYMTHKPYPAATEDIGTWEGIMRAVSIVAVITNIGIILFTAKLLLVEDIKYQLMLFILLEHIMFAVKVFIDQVIPDVAADTDELMERHKIVIDKYINEVDDDGVGDIKKTGQIIDEKFLKQIDTHDETIRKQL